MSPRLRHTIGTLVLAVTACACEPQRYPSVPPKSLWTPAGARVVHGPQTYADGAMDVAFDTPRVAAEEISAAVMGYYDLPWRRRPLVRGWSWELGPPGRLPTDGRTALSYWHGEWENDDGDVVIYYLRAESTQAGALTAVGGYGRHTRARHK